MADMFTALVGILYIVKQMLLDIAIMLTGNISALVGTSLPALLATVGAVLTDTAGMLIDIEGILEKVIDLLIS